MTHFAAVIVSFLFAGVWATSSAQPTAGGQGVVQTSGALVIVPAFGEVKHPNDEAYATLMIEEQDKEKTAAASRVNQKMKQGADVVKREDPQAVLQTRGYYTYPVYADDPAQSRPNNRTRQPVSWRVGQYLEVKTTNLNALPRMIAATQRVLALNGLQFGLSEEMRKKLEEQRISATYANLTERIAGISKAMGRNPADAVLDTLDFEGSGAYTPQDARLMQTMRAAPVEAKQMEEPNFEPGETTLSMRVVAKIRFK